MYYYMYYLFCFLLLSLMLQIYCCCHVDRLIQTQELRTHRMFISVEIVSYIYPKQKVSRSYKFQIQNKVGITRYDHIYIQKGNFPISCSIFIKSKPLSQTSKIPKG